MSLEQEAVCLSLRLSAADVSLSLVFPPSHSLSPLRASPAPSTHTPPSSPLTGSSLPAPHASHLSPPSTLPQLVHGGKGTRFTLSEDIYPEKGTCLRRPPAARAWCPVPAPLLAPASKRIVLLPQGPAGPPPRPERLGGPRRVRGKDDLLVLHGEEAIPVGIPESISPDMTYFLSQILGPQDRHCQVKSWALIPAQPLHG